MEMSCFTILFVPMRLHLEAFRVKLMVAHSGDHSGYVMV